MRNVIIIASFFIFLLSCNNEDDASNTIYKDKYERYIVYKDSINDTIKGNGIVRVSQKNNVYRFDFEGDFKSIKSLENIQMEMTGGNTLRNVDWTPSKLIMMTKDSLNISYQTKNETWFVSGLKKDIIKKDAK